MKIRNVLFSSAFVLSVLAAFAFKAPAPKQAFNAGLPSDCVPIALCPGGPTTCSVNGTQLKYIVNRHCTTLAYMH